MRLLFPHTHKVPVHIYPEFHSVCSLDPIAPTPLPQGSVFPPTRNQRRRRHTRLREGVWEGPNSDDWRTSLVLGLLHKVLTYVEYRQSCVCVFQNIDPPTPLSTQRVFPPPRNERMRGHACGWGGGRVPIRTTDKKPSFFVYSVYLK